MMTAIISSGRSAIRSAVSVGLRAFPLASVLALMAAFVQTCPATDRSWTGAVSDQWTEPGNWSPAGVPGINDAAYFLNDGTVRRTIVMPSSSLIISVPTVTVKALVFLGGGYNLHVVRGTRLLGMSYLSLETGIFSASTDARTNYVEPTVVLRGSQEFTSIGSGVLAVSGSINLNGFNLGLNTNPGYQWLTGVIFGSGDLIKRGTGLAFLGGSFANTYTGSTLVNGGELVLIKSPGVNAVPGDVYIENPATTYNAISLNAPEQIPDTAILHVGANGSFIPLGFSETVGGLNLSGNGRIDLRGSRLTLNGDVAASGINAAPSIGNGLLDLGDQPHAFFVDSLAVLQIGATIVSAPDSLPGLQKTGFGRLVLAGANTYSGPTLVSQGRVVATHNLALGDASPDTSATRVADGATLELAGTTALAETVVLDSADNSTVSLLTGSGALEGGLILNGPYTPVGTTGDQDTLEIRAPISGPGALVCVGPGTIRLSGSASNTYAGGTRVLSGQLRLSKAPPARAIPGPLSIEESAMVTAQDLMNSPQLADGVDLSIGPDATFASALHDETLRTLTGSGDVVLNGARLLIGAGDSGASTFYGNFSGGQGQIEKIGPGKLTLDYINDYWNEDFIGKLVATSGTLEVRDGFDQADVEVRSAATLSGDGYFSNLVAQSGATVEPTDDSMGGETLTLLPGSNLRIRLGNWQFGRYGASLYADRAATINGANLLLNLDGPVDLSEPYYALWLDGKTPIQGTFAGLPEGSQITLSGTTFRLSYHGDDGNDVSLTPAPFPLQLAGVRVTGGNGDSQIDPNECNDLFITLTNTQGAPLAGVHGILRAETPGITVSSPTAEWATLPAQGAAANQVGFQVRSESDLACGTTLAFSLVVSTPTQGTVVLPCTLNTGRGLAPFRFEQTAAVPLNADSVVSTNRISGFTTNLARLTVSVYLEHTSISNVQLILRNPRGNGISLCFRNGGSADRLGTGCAEETEQLTFDDDAAVSIVDTTALGGGTVRPRSALSRFNGSVAADVNGAWTLEVRTIDGPRNGTLHCWALSATPAACASGGGACPACLAAVSGNLEDVSSVLMPSFYGGSAPSIGGLVPDCTLQNDPPEGRRYRVHAFTNDGPATTVTVALRRDTPANKNRALDCYLFLDHFNPEQPCDTFLGNSGNPSPASMPGFAAAIPAGARFEIVVLEGLFGSATGYTSYELTVFGLGCPPPTLAIQPGAAPQTARLSWPATHPGFHLEQADNSLSFIRASQAPTLNHGRYEVTRPVPQNCSIFRLAK